MVDIQRPVTDEHKAEILERQGFQVTGQRRSPVQEGVEIVQRIVQLGATTYDQDIARLHELMSRFAFAEIREQYENHLRETDPDYVLTVEEVTDEANENTPMAEAYWAATSAFFRKVYQAAAAAA